MDELVKALRETDFGDTCVLCEHEDMCKGNDCIIIQAANAIEELQKRVPKRPHGRLIDADAALRDGWTINRTYSASPTEMVHEVKAIDCLPTIIPAEEGE